MAVSARDLNHTLNLDTQSRYISANQLSLCVGYFATFGNVQAQVYPPSNPPLMIADPNIKPQASLFKLEYVASFNGKSGNNGIISVSTDKIGFYVSRLS